MKTRGQAIASLTAPLPWFRCLARGDRAGARGDKKCTFEMHAEHEYTTLCAWHHPCGTLHPLFARTPAQAFTPGFKPFKMFITLHMPCHLFFLHLAPTHRTIYFDMTNYIQTNKHKYTWFFYSAHPVSLPNIFAKTLSLYHILPVEFSPWNISNSLCAKRCQCCLVSTSSTISTCNPTLSTFQRLTPTKLGDLAPFHSIYWLCFKQRSFELCWKFASDFQNILPAKLPPKVPMLCYLIFEQHDMMHMNAYEMYVCGTHCCVVRFPGCPCQGPEDKEPREGLRRQKSFRKGGWMA